MRSTRRLGSLVLVAGWLVAAVLMASPASADVDCSDLDSRAAAQTYLDGHPGDVDQLDADGDGRACEANATPHSTWTLVLLGVLFAAGLARYTTVVRKPQEKQHDQRAEVPEPVEAVVAPALVEQPAVRVAAPVQLRRRHQQGVVHVALTGSVSELARALRMVQYGERMNVLEAHAAAHGSTPQEVLD